MEEEKTVTVALRRTYGYKDGNYGPGEKVEIPVGLATALGINQPKPVERGVAEGGVLAVPEIDAANSERSGAEKPKRSEGTARSGRRGSTGVAKANVEVSSPKSKGSARSTRASARGSSRRK